MSAKEFLDEIMRRVEENWGEDASEGPYAKQEIVEGFREIIAEFKADIDRVVDRAVELVNEQVAGYDVTIPPLQVGDVVPMRDLIPRAPMCRCALVPLVPESE